MSPQSNLTFLGLTKTQFLGVLISLLVMLCAIQAYLLVRNTELAQQGAESHKALCVLDKDYAKRASDSEKFLRMSVPQRVKVYGDALGHIPTASIQQSLHNLRANLDSLSTLKCN